jgi:hypothetical protein
MLCALDPFTLAALAAHVEMLDQENRESGPEYEDHGVLFCRENGKPPHPDAVTQRLKKLSSAAGLQQALTVKLPTHFKRMVVPDAGCRDCVSRWGTAAATTTVWPVPRCGRPI